MEKGRKAKKILDLGKQKRSRVQIKDKGSLGLKLEKKNSMAKKKSIVGRARVHKKKKNKKSAGGVEKSRKKQSGAPVRWVMP